MTDIQQQEQERRETRSSKSRAAIPPSPAPSHSEIPTHGNMGEYLQHHQQNSTAYYPQGQSVTMDPRSQPATRYSTPVQSQSLYRPTSQHMMQQYPQYSYPQPPQQYEHSPFTFTDDYGTASSQPYSTPATSPPTPSRNTEVRVTRNGTYPRGGKAQQVSRPAPVPAPKKKTGKDRAKAVKKSPILSGPMSEITRDFKAAVIDIESYVHRSTEERIREVTDGKIPGKIKRPMNAFMLYRKAYQNRAKEYCSQHNHQVVSQVCGDSWPLEPDEVRAQFNEWAKIERDNHQKAHPAYKFTPSKPHNKGKAPAGKRGRDDEDDDPEDPDWHGSKRTRRMEAPMEDDEYQYGRALQNGGGYHQNRSAFHASNPGRPVPQPYDAHAAHGGHYYQAMHSRDGQIENVMLQKTPSPAIIHHPQHRSEYDMGGYSPPPQHQQMYPPPHHHQRYIDSPQQHHHQQQLVQYSPTAQYSPQSRVDPSLLASGSAGDLLDLNASYSQYPHQMDPAQWHDGPGGLYMDQTTTFELNQYGLPVGNEFEDATAMLQPEQEKIFDREAWEVLPADNLTAEGDNWLENIGDLPLQPATAGQLEELRGE